MSDSHSAESRHGRRVPDGEFLRLRDQGLISPGDYGCVPYTNAPTDWFVCCPDGSIARLWVNEDDGNGNRHAVTEHDDGTITVGGSIIGQHGTENPPNRARGPVVRGTWHGWLERGAWRSA